MGFVANPPASTPPAVTDEIPGDGWHPAISIAAFKVAQRLPSAVTDQRARDALLGAMASVDAELADWRDAQVQAGAAILADAIVRDRAGRALGPIGAEPRATVLWRRAVYAYAAADLAETHTDISATADGRARTEERASRAPELLRNATLAVRDILGRARSRVRLL